MAEDRSPAGLAGQATRAIRTGAVFFRPMHLCRGHTGPIFAPAGTPPAQAPLPEES